jgi:hypothetical protein
LPLDHGGQHFGNRRTGIHQVAVLGQFVQHGIGCGKGLARACRILAEGGNVRKDTVARSVIHQGEQISPVLAYALDQEGQGIDISYFIAWMDEAADPGMGAKACRATRMARAFSRVCRGLATSSKSAKPTK